MSEEERKTHVVAIGNQKGGVGKTTNTVHLATALGEAGHRCLIFDLDMNAGSTKHFGVRGEGFLGTFEVLTSEESALGVVLTNEEEDISLPPNVDLIASSRKLERIHEVLLSKNKFRALQDILEEPLKELRGHYDYILLDTAPNATPPTIAAYRSADWFILTAMPEPMAIDGLTEALEDIRDAQMHGNPNLRLLGLILCSVDKRTRLSNSLNNYVHEQFTPSGKRSLKFEATISRSTVIGQAQDMRKTLFDTHPTHRVTDQYRALAREVDARIREFTAPQASESGLSSPSAAVVAPRAIAESEPPTPEIGAAHG